MYSSRSKRVVFVERLSTLHPSFLILKARLTIFGIGSTYTRRRLARRVPCQGEYGPRQVDNAMADPLTHSIPSYQVHGQPSTLVILQSPPSTADNGLGHEVVGVIVAKGQAVSTRLSIGQRVVVSANVPCNDCFFCIQGEHLLCEKIKCHGVTGRLFFLSLFGRPHADSDA